MRYSKKSRGQSAYIKKIKKYNKYKKINKSRKKLKLLTRNKNMSRNKRSKHSKMLRRTSKKLNKRLKRTMRLRKQAKKQRGGGALKNMISMVPFGKTLIRNINDSDEQNVNVNDYVNDYENDYDNDYDNDNNTEQLNNQSVLVDTLCNQYIKNNIRGNNQSTYDGVLDHMCSNNTNVRGLGMGLARNTSTIGKLSRTSVGKQVKSKNMATKSTNTSLSKSKLKSKSQAGGTTESNIPSFLSGIKGFASMYSAPLRLGYNAVSSGIKSVSNMRNKSSTKLKTDQSKETENNTNEPLKVNKEQKLEPNTQKIIAKSSFEEDLERAEKEIAAENNTKQTNYRNMIMNSLQNNVN